jgi:hypothetical protein
VQAQLLAELADVCSEPGAAQLDSCLVGALAATISTAGGGSGLKLVWSSCQGGLSGLSHQQLCASLRCSSASGPEELQLLLRARAHQLTEPQGWGVPLLLYSALLSRGVAAARADMDEGSSAAAPGRGGGGGGGGLVAQHGYCGQELVSLLLTGAACSNLFNGSRRNLGGGLVLRGVPRRSRVGLLTLFEWYRWAAVQQHAAVAQSGTGEQGCKERFESARHCR